MSGFLDFPAIKQSNPIETVAQKLNLKLAKSGAQLRSPCPACGSGGDRALAITPSKGLFYCFAKQEGGDVIQLVAHVRGCSPREGAEWLVGPVPSTSSVPGTRTSTVRKEDANTSPSPGPGFQPLDYLDAAHDAVAAVGFPQEVAEALGVGFASKGILRGLVAVPLRTPEGVLVGYAGITEAKLPDRWHGLETNVVPLTKRA